MRYDTILYPLPRVSTRVMGSFLLYLHHQHYQRYQRPTWTTSTWSSIRTGHAQPQVSRPTLPKLEYTMGREELGPDGIRELGPDVWDNRPPSSHLAPPIAIDCVGLCRLRTCKVKKHCWTNYHRLLLVEYEETHCSMLGLCDVSTCLSYLSVYL